MSSTIPCPGRQCDVEFHYADSAEAANCKRKTELRAALAKGDGPGAVRSAAGEGPQVTFRDEHSRPYNVTKKIFRMTPDQAPVGGMIVGNTELETEQFSRYPRDEATSYYSIDATSFSAHTGDDVSHSNYRSLLRDFPNDFVAVEGEFSRELLVREDQPISEDLAEILRGLETDYPLYDSDDHEKLKSELYESSWDFDVAENLSDVIRENINRNHFNGDDELGINAWDFDRNKLKKIADEVIAEKQASGEDVLAYDGYGVELIRENEIVEEIVSRMNPDRMYTWDTSASQPTTNHEDGQIGEARLVRNLKKLDNGQIAAVDRIFTVVAEDQRTDSDIEEEEAPQPSYSILERLHFRTFDPAESSPELPGAERTFHTEFAQNDLPTFEDQDAAHDYLKMLVREAAAPGNLDVPEWDGEPRTSPKW